MKCTNCGSENLTEKMDLPFRIMGDAWLEWIGKQHCIFTCLDCGHIEFYNLDMVNKYKNKQKEIKDKECQIENISKEIESLQKIPFDKDKYLQEINDLENEIKTLESLKVNETDIKKRQNKICEYKKIIKSGKDPIISTKIYSLNESLKKLKKECEIIKTNLYN